MARRSLALLAALVVTSIAATSTAADPPPAAAPKAAAPPPPGPAPNPVPEAYYPYAYPYGYAPMPVVSLPPPAKRERYSGPMMITGIVLTTAGVVSVIAGSALVSTSVDRVDIYCDSPSFPCAHKDDATRKTAGAVFMATGGAMSIAGVVLWVVGSKMVLAPKKDEPKPAVAWRPNVDVGLGSARLSLQF